MIVAHPVIITAYSANDSKQHTRIYTAIGRNGLKTKGVAVDKRIFPLGGHLFINEKKYLIDDTGVMGWKLDLRLTSRHECIQFGRKRAIVYYELNRTKRKTKCSTGAVCKLRENKKVFQSNRTNTKYNIRNKTINRTNR